MTRFHNCNADYEEVHLLNSDLHMLIKQHCDEICKIYELQDYIKFTSYYSVVAIYDLNCNVMWLLPRWDFSPTTTRQVTRWVSEVTGNRMTAKDLRSEAKENLCFRYADSYSLGRVDGLFNPNWKTH